MVRITTEFYLPDIKAVALLAFRVLSLQVVMRHTFCYAHDDREGRSLEVDMVVKSKEGAESSDRAPFCLCAWQGAPA